MEPLESDLVVVFRELMVSRGSVMSAQARRSQGVGAPLASWRPCSGSAIGLAFVELDPCAALTSQDWFVV